MGLALEMSSRYKPVSKVLQAIYVRGTREQRDAVILGYSRACMKLAGRYSKNPEHLDELFQAGMEGVTYAANLFDPKLGAFSTIATWKMKGAMKAAAERLGLIRLPHNVNKLVRQYYIAEEYLYKQNMIPPSFDEVVKFMDLNIDNEAALRNGMNKPGGIEYEDGQEDIPDRSECWSEMEFREDVTMATKKVEAILTPIEREVFYEKLEGNLSRQEMADKRGWDIKKLADVERHIRVLLND